MVPGYCLFILVNVHICPFQCVCVCVYLVGSYSRFSFSVVSDTMIWQGIGPFLCQQVIIKGVWLISHTFTFWRVFSTDFSIMDKYRGHLSYCAAALHH